jgi:pyruvate dehydrogenase E1 component
MPEEPGVREGILRGMYRFRRGTDLPGAETGGDRLRVHLLGSGAILNEAIKAQALLAEQYKVSADVWSVTSYKALYTDAMECERWNLLHPDKDPHTPYVSSLFSDGLGVFVAASDYMKVLPASIAQWLPGSLHCLGTDGFGRSDGRRELRDFFEVDARYIALAALRQLALQGVLPRNTPARAIENLGINPDKANPLGD